MPIDNTTKEEMRVVVVVPTYHNEQTLMRVLREIQAHTDAVIVIDDGCEDGTPGLLEGWQRDQPANRHVLTHENNLGKAAALHSGFNFAASQGFTHAVTIDSDGQHDPADIPRMIEAATQSPRSLVVGVRRTDLEDYPGKNKLGRVFSNLAVRLESGVHLRDTQCGFRVYPLGLLDFVRCKFGRYAFETEVLTRTVWSGAGVVQVPVTCIYKIPGGERVTHFRPLRDTIHGLWLHARLLTLAVLPIPHPHRWIDPNGRREKPSEPEAMWRRVLHWLNPLRAWREIRRGDLGRVELAAGLGVGVFIGMLPVYGLHTVMCLYTSARLHLNPHVTVAGSAIYASPPQGILAIALCIMTGQFVLRGKLISPNELNLEGMTWFEIAGRFYLDWLVGSLILGFTLAVLTGLAGYLFFGLIRAKKQPGDSVDAEVAQVDSI